MNTLITRSRLFDDFFKDLSPGFFVRPLHGEPLPAPDQIRIDVRDVGEEYVVQADVPGVKKEDIEVHIDGNLITLSAQVNQVDEKVRDGKVVHSERYSGTVSRSLSLPTDVDRDKAKARCEDGVLTLTLPKASASRPTRLLVE